jgi:hypothetical protein
MEGDILEFPDQITQTIRYPSEITTKQSTVMQRPIPATREIRMRVKLESSAIHL